MAAEVRRRRVTLEPMYYGLPDLLFPQNFLPGKFDMSTLTIVRERMPKDETLEEYQRRQDQAIYNMVTQHLSIVKDDRMVKIRLIPKMAKLLGDLFFRRVNKLILWANRGGGKSLLAAIFMWTAFVYLKRSFLNIGGAGNQAKRVYDYTTQFWTNFPGMKDGMLTREPLLQRTEMTNGSKLICATSGTTAIGEHIAGFVADEAATDRPGADNDIMRAMQGAMSEPDPCIFLLSTFHLPTGLFANTWEEGENLGFTRMKWSCVLPDTWMLTHTGLRQARDVVAGDQVLTEDGQLHEVTRAWSKTSQKDAVTLYPYGWTMGLEVTADHKMLVNRDGSEQWILAGDIVVGDRLVFPRPKPYEKLLTVWPGSTFELTPDFCRFLGYFVGDGWLDVNKVVAAFGKTDKYKDDYVALVAKLFARKVYVDHEAPNERGRFGHTLLVEHMRVFYDAQGVKCVPSWVVFGLSDECLRQFVVGLMRTDGCVTHNAPGQIPVAKFGQVSSSVTQAFFLACARLGLHPSLDRKKQSTTTIEGRAVTGQDWWMVRFGGADTETLLSWMGMPMPARKKYNRPQWELEKDRFLTPVRKVERRPYDGVVFDFSVDGVHSFTMPWAVAHNCFDSMERCTAGLETATPEDPTASNFCHTQCPLTWQVDTYDQFGNVTGKEFKGCRGHARNSSGWQSRETVLEEQRINQGTRIFVVEHACERPEREGQIYNKELIDACVRDYFNLVMERRKIVGVDWGLTQCAMVLLGWWSEENPEDPEFPTEGLGLIDVVFMSNRLVDVVVAQIRSWQLRYGDDVVVRADGSHPYCNRELATHGYTVRPVYGDKKLLGEDNMARWIGSSAFRILGGFDLYMMQLHNLRRNTTTGKQLKENLEGDEGDHGPDATKFALMEVDYVKWFNMRLRLRQSRQAALSEAKKKTGPGRRGLDALLYQ